jgi:hypothetical protein
LNEATAIAAGDYHTVALMRNGTVIAWGRNDYGQTDVPGNLTDVKFIAAGHPHSLAVKSNGTVVAWGLNSSGETNVPPGLSGVAAVAAGGNHTVALREDGSLAAWGANNSGQTTIPPGLTGVRAIGAGVAHTVVLKSNGTVVAWGLNGEGQTNVPAGLSGVMAVAAGNLHTVALMSNGTVVAWGRNVEGQTNVPVGLSNVIAIAAGYGHNLALKADGTVAAWGYNFQGQTTIPAGLHGVTSIAAGGFHSVAIAQLPPQITAQPTNQVVTEGQSVTFTVAATGPILRYQWRKEGTDILGATNASFTRSAVNLNDAGLYSVVVSNDFGVVLSSNALLVVVAFGSPAIFADGERVIGSVTRWASATLTLETAFAQGYIFYTLDGAAPTFSSSLYAGPLTISNTVVVRALALSSDFSQTAEAPAATIFILPYTVSATSGGAGVAAVSPAQSFYASNSVVTLTATPDSGWSFLRWEGDASGSSNPLGLTVNRSLQVQAVFGTSLLTNMLGSGRIEITPGGPVPYGGTVQLRAVPGPGQKFVAWGGAVSGTNNSRPFTVTQPSPTVAALFAAGPAGLPFFTSQPSNRVVSAGGSVILSAAASGDGPLQYQWRQNGAAIVGATNVSLEITNAAVSQAGAYDVVVTGPAGTTTSDRALVVVSQFDVRPVLSLSGASGTGFRVDYTDDLDGGPWLLLTNGVLSSERRDVIDFTSTNRVRRFYRTLVEP